MKPIATLPEITAVVDGAPLPADASRTLYHVQVRQRLSVPGQCELAFSPPPSGVDLHTRFEPGKSLQVRIGKQREVLFTGDITAVELGYGPSAQHVIRVRAYDRLHRLRKRQPVRTHRQLTPRELAVNLTADLGVTVHSKDPGPVLDQIIQHRQSDFELLVEIAQRYGMYPSLRRDDLHLNTLDGTGPPVGLTYGDNLLEAQIERNAEAICQQVTATGWDPLRIEGRSGQSATARNLRVNGLAPEALGASGERHITGETAPDDGHLDEVAQAELERRAAHETVLRGVTEGDPRLHPGTRVQISGVASAMEGRYVLTSVVHTLDGEQGFVSEISSAPPPLIPTASRTLATLGIVSRVNDPETLGRIKATLPAYDNLETQWLHVVSPGAGAGKGLTAVPDVEDTVLVLCSDRNPGEGVVLGGLYGMDGPDDSGVESNAVRRFTFGTPGGHQLRLDDQNNLLLLQDSSGNRLELSPDRVHLLSAGTLEIEAPGQSVVIRGQSIDFQKG